MAHAQLPIVTARVAGTRGFGETVRRDAWWVQPLTVFTVLSAFVVYATWAAFQNAHYTFGPYLSPFYSPELFGSSHHAWLGPKPGWWPGWLPFSPALLILPLPGLFRVTCYYYRGAYYKGFWADPPACAVGEPRKSYWGEQRLPLTAQNVHRYFLYAALVINAILFYDAVLAFRDETGEWGHMGLGTAILLVNAVLLFLYSLSCHSCRHIVGGRLNNFSKHPLRYRAWTFVSKLNGRHMQFAWASLFSVAIADLYVFLLATGTIDDLRFF